MNINWVSHYIYGEKLYQKIVNKVVKKYNLTFMEFNIIMFLYNNPQYDTASQIISHRRLTKSHVSTSIKTLEEKELLVTAHFQNDKKTIHLKLTKLSNPITKDGVIAQDEFAKALMENFSKKEIDTLQRLIEKMNVNIDKNLRKEPKKDE